jgi:hypothetical protein
VVVTQRDSITVKFWEKGFNPTYTHVMRCLKYAELWHMALMLTILSPRDSRSAYGSVFRAARKGHVPGVMVSCMSVLRSGGYLQ